jgi:hypothetical protein
LHAGFIGHNRISHFGIWSAFYDEVASGQSKHLKLLLKNVHVVYRGGEMIPFAQMLCDHCTFEIESPNIPPPTGKQLIRMLLAGETYNVNISGNEAV